MVTPARSFVWTDVARPIQPVTSKIGRGQAPPQAKRLYARQGDKRADPVAFLSGAQGGGDPLALLVAGFVLGYNARQGGGA